MTGKVDLGESRITQLEDVVRALEPAQFEALTTAAESTPTSGHWPSSELPFWFRGTAKIRLSEEHEAMLAALWTRLQAAAAFAVSGEEVVDWVERPGLLGRLDRIVQPRKSARIEGRATAVLERRFGREVWVGFVAIWNAACAALLEDILDPGTFADLQGAWRAVFHRPLQPISTTPELDPFSAWR
jgi:hypothetical protein